jgi:RND superfamily putative drug exporter
VAAFLDRLGRTAFRRHWRVIGAWVGAALAIGALAIATGGHTFDNFTIPGSQAQTALDLLESRFPAQSGGSATVVFHAGTGTLASASSEAAVEQSVANLRELPGSPIVTGPLPSKDGTSAIAAVQYSRPITELGATTLSEIEKAAAPASAAAIQVSYGGPLVDYASSPKSSASDLVGLVFAIFILVFAFGSLIAAGLPIGTALFGLVVGISGILLLSSVVDVGSAAPELGSMIGLGVGIDYSLFIVTRHRENLASGMDLEASVGRALATAGQAVLFAGTTVVIAITGLLIAGIPYVTVLGFSAAIVVAVMMLAALTFLPALLGLAGHHIERSHLKLPWRRDHEPTAPSVAQSADTGFWARWAERVARHPWPFALASVALLITLALPFNWIRYGQTDDGTAPAGSTQRIAFDQIAQSFGPGANGPLLVVVTYPRGDTLPPTLISSLQSTPGVAEVAPAKANPAGDTSVIEVQPTTAPDDAATTTLVNQLRASVVPDALHGTKAQGYVGGVTAAYIDIGTRVADRLPLFIGLVVLLSFLLLMLVFHSVAIPLTAGVMNLLSVGAAYGVTVAVFQWGWAKSLFGLESTVPIVSFVPMMMFAILFGLSMDYQVFLLTRIREEYDKRQDTRAAVVTGVSRTARVITSAALIMIAVFLSFVASPIPEIKMFGLGLAVAVAVDSTAVRMVLVPALMEILGRANWWFPKRLERVVPKISIE